MSALRRDGVVEPPEALAAVAELERAQVVQVAALGVHHFAQQTLAHHVERHQFHAVVAAVFELHAVPARCFGGLHQLPALFERGDRGHLRRGMLAVLHGFDGHARMPLPRRRDVDQVEVLPRAEPLEVLLALGVGLRPRPAGFLGEVLDVFNFAGDDVAGSLELDARDAEEVPHVAGTASAHPHDADAHSGQTLLLGGSGHGKTGCQGGSAFEKIPAVLVCTHDRP